MKFPHTKFGLACDPRGAHVTFDYKGRTLIGEVVDVEYDEWRGIIELIVEHFCGEPWPIRPSSRLVDVLPRR